LQGVRLMKKLSLPLGIVILVSLILAGRLAGQSPIAPGISGVPLKPTEFKGYAGSASCIECHEKFYKLWSTSFHGLAMQPYTARLAAEKLIPQTKDIVIGKHSYRMDVSTNGGFMTERGHDGAKTYRIEHAMGGKNVFYFLTTLEKGRLQTLPVAYDMNRREWFDTAASGIRHIPGRRPEAPFHWKDPEYTFNSQCYSCHVSQLSTNYDAKTDAYRTIWREPGINCEACHGPSEEHNRVCAEAPEGTVPTDLKIISWKKFTPAQKSDTCAPCHARMVPITNTFMPGDRFFDHYDLVTLEDPDYYPDGRDLGETFTHTTWLMSPCVKSGKLDCLHCHTSSGRYRFKAKEKLNHDCLPCHEARVKDAPAHTNHPADTPGNRCVSCHMPMTEFARMRRSDHSLLPPVPAATIAFKSPNACNICHTDKNARWADENVRKWRSRDYQAPFLYRAGLVDAARKRDWSRLPDIAAYLASRDRDEVFAASLIRLLRTCPLREKWPAILDAMKDPSPLVRSSAAAALSSYPSAETVRALISATGDDYRLVRIRAAASLAGYPRAAIPRGDRKKVDGALQEYVNSIMMRTDHWTSYYNMGNYYLSAGYPKEAVGAYGTAARLDPRTPYPLVNMSMAYARFGDNRNAEQSLRKALKLDPQNATAHFNLGLLMAEQKKMKQAENELRLALKYDPQMAEAAYNLCVIVSKNRLDEAVKYCGTAADLRPQDPRYAYTLAYFRNRKGDEKAAVKTLEGLIAKEPAYADAYLLLGGIYEKQGKEKEAETVYRKALAQEGIPESYKTGIRAKLDNPKSGGPSKR
jgi:Tfp pilus assembly protein PilF